MTTVRIRYVFSILLALLPRRKVGARRSFVMLVATSFPAASGSDRISLHMLLNLFRVHCVGFLYGLTYRALKFILRVMGEADFHKLRNLMVDTQIIPRGVKDPRVLEAIRKVPRHLFMDESQWDRAYDDMALPAGGGQTISQPYMVAVMTELLDLTGDEKVLELGTGTGYQAAILAELSRELYSIERIRPLSEKAGKVLADLGYENVHLIVGDGTLGWPEAAPFDRILITAGAPEIPEPLIGQLSEGGIIVAPLGDRFSQQLVKVTKRNGKLSKKYHTPCVFVPLIGKYGWEGEQ
jgi:protein-L-isoaspartate(D-aspartate) O-methyltransferase